MKEDRKQLITFIFVIIVLLSGFALSPLFVFARETRFSWESYMFAYFPPISNYLPVIFK